MTSDVTVITYDTPDAASAKKIIFDKALQSNFDILGDDTPPTDIVELGPLRRRFFHIAKKYSIQFKKTANEEAIFSLKMILKVHDDLWASSWQNVGRYRS